MCDASCAQMGCGKWAKSDQRRYCTTKIFIVGTTTTYDI